MPVKLPKVSLKLPLMRVFCAVTFFKPYQGRCWSDLPGGFLIPSHCKMGGVRVISNQSGFLSRQAGPALPPEGGFGTPHFP